MKHTLLIACFSLLILILAGCIPEIATEQVTVAVTRSQPTKTTTAVSIQPSAEPTNAPTNTPLPSPTTVPTQTPQPTNTLIPPTISPTPIPTALPTKSWLIRLSYPGGDGGTIYDIFFGRGMPDLILFTDGQLLIRNKNGGSGKFFENQWYTETYLSQEEVQSLFTQIEETGFFEQVQERSSNEADWLYNFDETTEFSDGAGGPSFCITFSDETTCLSIYGPYIPYLVPEIANAYFLIQAYHPANETYAFYDPENIVMRVEPMRGNISTDAISQSWPADLPSLSQLLEMYPAGVIPLDGEEATLLFSLFNHQIDDGIFVEAGLEYYVIGRPLLPHEALEYFLRR